ncbi:MAG TPA: amylo-alpha-1,6-glucosidase, partial [Fusibacter sp.]|nr:amylo-alpha-1,6-glucosidase [Fusibacter sp.]
YEGDLLSRDGAYHRGTAWGWLIGPYLEAHLKTFHDRATVKADLEMLFTHLDEGIHGSISEIFEGGEPHAQRGCSAQAWSVAEAIRIWKLIK